jgi:hypothetical protein
MLEMINQSKTFLKNLVTEEEISVSKENYLTESKWKIIPQLLELLQAFKQEQLKEEEDQYITISLVPTPVRQLMTTLSECAFTKSDLPLSSTDA